MSPDEVVEWAFVAFLVLIPIAGAAAGVIFAFATVINWFDRRRERMR